MSSTFEPLRHSITFITTCKGRRHQLEQTLPKMVAEAPDEIVVVDYGCPDGTGEWVRECFPSIRVVHVDDDPGFIVARARNLGAAAASSRWFCFIDADIVIEPGFVAWLRANLRDYAYFRRAVVENVPGYNELGTFLCTREAFAHVHGYDEVMIAYGSEDLDLYERLSIAGISAAAYPARFVNALKHGDDERLRFKAIKNRTASVVLIRLYRAAKRQAMAFYGVQTELPRALREQLYAQIRDAVIAWDSGPDQPLPTVTFTLKGGSWLPEPYRMLKTCSFSLSVAVADKQAATQPRKQAP